MMSKDPCLDWIQSLQGVISKSEKKHHVACPSLYLCLNQLLKLETQPKYLVVALRHGI